MEPLHFFALAILLLVTAGCASESPVGSASSSPPSASSAGPQVGATAQPDEKSRPFLFNEASLPEGYPPPGPVGQIIVRQYPAARIAVNRCGDQDDLFMPLFDHIKKHDIAMSAPVEITWSDPQTQPSETKPQSMAFVYREPDIGTPGVDGKIDVIDVPAQTYLSIGVRGSYNRAHLIDGVTQLRHWLAAHSAQYQADGPPRYLAYNSPFVPWFLRFGEVQIPIAPIGGQP